MKNALQSEIMYKRYQSPRITRSYHSINYMFSIHGIPYLPEYKMILHITQLTFKILNFQEIT